MSVGENKSYTLKVGFYCNNNCISCSESHRKPWDDLSAEKAKALLDEGRNRESKTLVLTGGEPTMRPDLPALAEYAKKTGYEYIVLQTNGRMLYYRNYCERLVNAGIDCFMFGFHGTNAKTHDFISQCSGAFEQALQGGEEHKATQ